MALKVLQLTDYSVKTAMRHDAIKGKKPIGRGAFSAIFEGSKPSTVYKMTVDSFSYWMLNCYAYGLKHYHFPKTFNNFGMIGEIRVGKVDAPIYLFEMERLQKLSRSNETRRLASQIGSTNDHYRIAMMGQCNSDKAAKSLEKMIVDKELPTSVRNAFKQLYDFCLNYPGAGLDMHLGNFMQRKNGQLVITDPLMDIGVYEARVDQLQRRGF